MGDVPFPGSELAAEPPRCGDERHTLVTFLDYFRTVLTRKAAGLTHTQLNTPTTISPLTIAGLVRHMTFVEDHWFRFVLLGEDYPDPWVDAPWDDRPDWEFDTAAESTPAQLLAHFEESVARSRAALAQYDDLGVLAARPSHGQDTSVRWILVHMIEEYARHCGHADLVRESLDGATGD